MTDEQLIAAAGVKVGDIVTLERNGPNTYVYVNHELRVKDVWGCMTVLAREEKKG